MDSKYKNINLSIENKVAILKFNRPEQLNAMNRQMMDEIIDGIVTINNNEYVKVAVITGSGRAFMAGADIKEYGSQTEEQFRSFQERGIALYEAIENAPKPWIAAVNGFALGGGFEIALSCDLILASDSAKMGLPEVFLSLIPGGGGTQRLIQKIGVNRVREMLYLGAQYSSEQLHTWGIVNQIVAEGEFDVAVMQYAEKLSRRSPSAIKQLKRLVQLSLTSLSFDQKIEEEAKAVTELFYGLEAKKAIQDFIQKNMKAALLILFIGSYTEYPIPGFGGIGHGVYTVQLNTETGELRTLHTMMARNPSYLVVSDDHQFLYCVNELDESETPKVGAYKINADYSLQFLNEQPIAGGYPCHIKTFGNNVLVACYATGNIHQFPVDASGKLGPAVQQYSHVGSSINSERQEAPHAHQIAVHPNGRDVYVCDLGIDIIKAYHFKGKNLVPNDIKDCKISKGSGPRHMVFDAAGNLGYVNNELTGTVSVLKRKEGSFDEEEIYSALPNDYIDLPSGSAIRIHPNGQFLYVANRKLEAISIFRIVKDKLEPIECQYTKGEELREFNITPDGNWLIACHQNSHDTVVYQIKEDGRLQERYRTKEILSPSCVVFNN